MDEDLLARIEWRDAATVDEELLEVATWVAVTWDGAPVDRAEVRRRPELVHYFAGFGLRPGDVGVVAQTETETAGVAWARRFSAADPGYGYVADDLPEASVCVFADYRRRGLGRELMERLHERLRAQGVAGVSLSVAEHNGAAELHEQLGYRAVGRSGDADTMLLDLRS